MIFHNLAKQIKLTLRDKNYFIFTLIFPVALIFVLGNLLSGSFSQDASVKLQIVYEQNGSSQLGQAFEQFAKAAGSKNVTFTAVKSEAAGKKKVRNGQATAFVRTENEELSVATNYPDSVEKVMLDSYIGAFSSEYSFIKGTAQINPAQIEKAVQQVKLPKEAIVTEKVSDSSHISSFEYYAIGMISMTMMMGLAYGINSYRSEKLRNTAVRLETAPVRKTQILFGNFLGELAVQVLALIILMLVSQFIFGVQWGEYGIFIFAIFLSLGIFSVFLGMSLDIFSNGNSAIAGASTIIVNIFAFIGGAYFPMISPTVQKFSPIGWANISSREILYNHDLSAMIIPITMNLGMTFILLLLVLFVQKRRRA
ncbi:ABC transporter permease [Listeria aquatica]|uniref:ABC transporter permease YfiM n=2 Tax=Listeria aquatica TaxID=1494960 RepID=W7BDZ7_9LIST|nr:ABC transporter permease [Listeria aquatica]EUJ21351.1 ABC transporter permease YfiM [Listeria aquatica FSL S10-1188]